jgi:hypothetical protein
LSTAFGVFTLGSAASLDITADATPTIDAFTATAAASVDIDAALDATLAAFTLAADATVVDGLAASLDATLGAFTVDAAASLDIAATVDATLDAFTVTAAGGLEIDGALDATLDAFALNSAATFGEVVPVPSPGARGGGGAGYRWIGHAKVNWREIEAAVREAMDILEGREDTLVAEAIDEAPPAEIAEIREAAAEAVAETVETRKREVAQDALVRLAIKKVEAEIREYIAERQDEEDLMEVLAA